MFPFLTSSLAVFLAIICPFSECFYHDNIVICVHSTTTKTFLQHPYQDQTANPCRFPLGHLRLVYFRLGIRHRDQNSDNDQFLDVWWKRVELNGFQYLWFWQVYPSLVLSRATLQAWFRIHGLIRSVFIKFIDYLILASNSHLVPFLLDYDKTRHTLDLPNPLMARTPSTK